MRLFLETVSVVAPGLDGWANSRSVLAGLTPYHATRLAAFSPAILPLNERRRVTPTIRIALQVATEALQISTIAAQDCRTVFASGNGDLDIVDRICAALNREARPVSPTDFHNSVHNAPAGYWAIGSACRLPSTSISAGPASFAAGLLEAATQALGASQPTLLVCYELPVPTALSALCRTDQPFAVGLLLHSQRCAAGLGEITLQVVERNQRISDLRNPELAPLLHGNSATQSLPLLEILARGAADQCRMSYNAGNDLLVDFTPC